MEGRFGGIRTSLIVLTVRADRCDVYQILKVIGVDSDGIRPIDAHYRHGPDRFAFRYFDRRRG